MKKKLLVALIPLAMRLMIIQILFVVSVLPSYGTDARGQDALNKKISISFTNTKLKTVLEKVEDIVDAKFVFSPTIINVKRKLSFSIQDITVADFLKHGASELGLYDYWTGCDGNSCAQWTGVGQGSYGRNGALVSGVAPCSRANMNVLCICIV